MVDFVRVEEAKSRSGLRVVMVGMVPSPWGEAAKGIFHVEKIPYVAARLSDEMQAVSAWTGHESAPIAVYDDEQPRTGWAEILLLAERLADRPSLVPTDCEQRALVIGLSHEICGEDGLGWARRLQGVHAALTDTVGYPKPVAEYLAPKYGYRAEIGDAAGTRVIALLRMFSSRLRTQRDAGSRYLVGDSLSAADIYLATFIAMFTPLAQDLCKMPSAFREAFEAMDDATRDALDPVLVEHRDHVYETHLELPLQL